MTAELKAKLKELSSRYQWVLDWTTFILAVLAILFAVIQYFDSRSLLGSTQKNLEEARAISSSMSTAYVGEFPENLGEINRLTSGAVKRLDIMTDLLGYANYSDPEHFDEYKGNLERLAGKGVKIKMIVYTGSVAKDIFRGEFPIGDFENEKARPRYTRYFHDYHRNLALPSTYNQFIEGLNKAEEEYAKALAGRANIEIRHIQGKLPFYVWLQGDREAIFSFLQSAGPQAQELAFRTSDGKLIATFTDTFKGLWDNETVESHANPSLPH